MDGRLNFFSFFWQDRRAFTHLLAGTPAGWFIAH
jgi:hypothetical protein